MTAAEVAARGAEFVPRGAHADVAAVVVTYNSAADIGGLIDDLRAAAATKTIRLIIVDNQSTDDTAQIAGRHDDVVFVESGGNLGYAGGINVGLTLVEPCESVLILNPDLRVKPDAIDRMLETLMRIPRPGVVLPRILDEDEVTYPSLRFEPSITRSVGDALFGSKLWLSRPSMLSEFDYRRESYERTHDVDWGTGAALLIRADVAREIGQWNEDFFLYSEEIDYLRRVRDSGYRVRFDPAAVVRHRLGGSGVSPSLASLMAVNRIRYAEMHHGRVYSAAIRGAVALAEILRAYDATHRRTLGVVLNRRRWRDLPAATKPVVPDPISGCKDRGAVIIPAYNEATVIERTLAPLSAAVQQGYIEVIVVCNGCTDDTAKRAERVPGVQVVNLGTGSKTLALNTGDEVATLWPRLYLDADIQITAQSVLAVLDRLNRGDVLAARPAFRYGTDNAGALVRSYYRARTRTSVNRDALWWAGVYGLSHEGHRRFGRFPDVTGDDLFVDSQFGVSEKLVVPCEPSVWTTPTDVKGLLNVLTRHHRGNAALVASDSAPDTGRSTARAILATVRGPRSAVDGIVYSVMALAARARARRSKVAWERDDSSRSVR